MKQFKVEIDMPHENAVVEVTVSRGLLGLSFDTHSCVSTFFLFERESADDVRRMANALLQAANVLAGQATH